MSETEPDYNPISYLEPGEHLLFVTSGRKVCYLSNSIPCAIENDRERHVLRALLTLALERLDFPQFSVSLEPPSGVEQ